MATAARGYARIRATITDRLNAHDLLGVLDLGAPDDEYDPEAEDFARLNAKGEAITPEVVAAVWQKWFGEPSEEPAHPRSRWRPWPQTCQVFNGPMVTGSIGSRLRACQRIRSASYRA